MNDNTYDKDPEPDLSYVPGWRILDIGEKLLPTDHVWWGENNHRPLNVVDPHAKVGDAQAFSYPYGFYRRKVEEEVKYNNKVKTQVNFKEPASINVTQLVVGQLAVITDWMHKQYIGWVVMRDRDGYLVRVGHPRGQGWDNIPWNVIDSWDKWEDCRVRVFRPGDQVVLTVE